MPRSRRPSSLEMYQSQAAGLVKSTMASPLKETHQINIAKSWWTCNNGLTVARDLIE